MKYKVFLSLILAQLIALASLAATKTITSGSWLVGSNWSPAGIPVDGDDIIIDGNVSIPAENNDITLNNVTIVITSSGYLTIGKKCDLTLNSTSTILVQSSGAIEGTHGNSVAIIGVSGNLLGNKVYTGPAAANISGWNVSSTSFLPVELLDFVANMMEDYVQLEWSTASETNNDYFVIERKTETEEWKAIGQVHGYGTSNEIHFYEYQDYDIDPYLPSYYRLVQVDMDGTEHHHHSILVESLKLQGHKYEVIHNQHEIQVLFQDYHNERTEVILFDAAGNVLEKKVIPHADKGDVVNLSTVGLEGSWIVLGIFGEDNYHFEKMILVK